MTIFVTGGTGYIGSHTCVALLAAGYDVVIADNLCNSKAETVEKIEQISGKKVVFYKVDVTEEAAVEPVFAKHHFDGVIHLLLLYNRQYDGAGKIVPKVQRKAFCFQFISHSVR